MLPNVAWPTSLTSLLALNLEGHSTPRVVFKERWNPAQTPRNQKISTSISPFTHPNPASAPPHQVLLHPPHPCWDPPSRAAHAARHSAARRLAPGRPSRGKRLMALNGWLGSNWWRMQKKISTTVTQLRNSSPWCPNVYNPLFSHDVQSLLCVGDRVRTSVVMMVVG